MLAVFSVTNLLDAGAGSLRQAVIDANNTLGADEVQFSVTGTIDIASQLPTITDAVTISGPGQDLLTIDAGNGTDNAFDTGDGYRIFFIDDGAGPLIDVELHGLTLTGGDVGGSFPDNIGGAIYNRENLTLTGSTISGNAAGAFGGGIFNFGTTTFTGTTLSGNSASSSGGGIFNNGNATIADSTLSGNAAVFGGGIFSNTASDFVTTVTRITGSTISGNTATIGGGVHNSNGLTVIRYSTITLNDASSGGDGVWSFGDGFTRTDIGSSIVAGNVGDDDVHTFGELNEFVSLGYNLIGGGNDAGAFVAAGDQTGILNPLLDALADNGGPTQTHALVLGSPAINAGDPTAMAGVGDVPLYDQRGAPFGRVNGGRIDIGAVETEAVVLLGDGNLDGKVDGLDYLIWAGAFGDDPADDPPGSPENGDYNDDGKVDGLDYLVWAGNFGAGTATPTAQPAATTATSTDPQFAAVDLALEDDYDTGVTVADDPAMRKWQLSRAFDSVLKKRDKKGK